jgi:hypothetical protein
VRWPIATTHAEEVRTAPKALRVLASLELSPAQLFRPFISIWPQMKNPQQPFIHNQRSSAENK